MGHQYEEPAMRSQSVFDDGFFVGLIERDGETLIRVVGSSGREIIIDHDSAPHLAAMLLTVWHEDMVEEYDYDDDEDDD